MLASSQKSIAQSYPSPGWVEEDPEEIFVSQLDTLLEVMDQLETRYAIGPRKLPASGSPTNARLLSSGIARRGDRSTQLLSGNAGGQLRFVPVA
jgi:hypothetical protein